jgi:hypothetical protein
MGLTFFFKKQPRSQNSHLKWKVFSIEYFIFSLEKEKFVNKVDTLASWMFFFLGIRKRKTEVEEVDE